MSCVIYLTLNLECLDDMNRDVYIQLDSCFVYLKYHLQTIQYKLLECVNNKLRYSLIAIESLAFLASESGIVMVSETTNKLGIYYLRLELAKKWKRKDETHITFMIR